MQTFFITGASTGIGRAMALYFARAGARVFATMRSPGRAGPSLLDLASAEDLALSVLALDVCDAESVSAAVTEATREAGRIDVLVNNAGVATLGTVEESPVGWLAQTLDTNVMGVVRTIQAVLPDMRARGSGVIVNVSSVSGRLASPGVGHYSASKHALEAISESLAAEIHPFGVRVIVLQPGFVSTPLVGKLRLPDTSLTGPYAELMKKQLEFFEVSASTGDRPEVVAEVLEAALADPRPRLRYLCAASAAPSMDFRASVTDEEWVGMTEAAR